MGVSRFRYFNWAEFLQSINLIQNITLMFYRVAPVSRVVVGHVLLLQWVLESAHVPWMDGCLRSPWTEPPVMRALPVAVHKWVWPHQGHIRPRRGRLFHHLGHLQPLPLQVGAEVELGHQVSLNFKIQSWRIAYKRLLTQCSFLLYMAITPWIYLYLAA